MADGTISVDLQLIVADALKQAELAAKSFSKILSTPAMTPGGQQFSAQKAVADTAKITAAEQQHTKAVKETTKALTEQQKVAQRLRDIASGKISPVQPDMKITGVNSRGAPAWMSPEQAQKFSKEEYFERKKLADDLRAQRAARRGTGGIGSLGTNPMTMFGDEKPVPPVLPKSTTAGTSKHSQTINGTLIRSLVGSIAGSALAGPIGAGLGASYSGASAQFSIAIGAVTAGLKALRMAATETAAAFERAKNLYAKTLQSGGLGQAFVTRQNILAGVLGVSEQDVMQYGMAIGVLNQKLAFATRIITETQPALTATAWNFSVLKENLKAVWATLAEAVAPAINRILELVNALAKLEVLSGVVTMLGKAISFAIDSLTRLVAIAEIAPAAMLLVATTLKDVVVGLALTFYDAAKALVSPMIAVMKLITTAISDAFQWLLTRVENHLAKSWIGKKMGIGEVEETGFEKTEAAFAAAKKAASGVSFQNKFDFTKTKEAASAFKDVLKAAFGSQSPYKETAPATPANINRMPSSAWEKMGMVLGMGGRTDHAAVTAKGVTKLVELTQKLVQQRITNHNDSFANPMAAMP